MFKSLIRFFYSGNEKIVEFCAVAVATIWAVDLTFVAVVYPMFIQATWTPTTLVQYLSSSVFQAVMLPILAYMADRSEKKQKQQFDRMEHKIDLEFRRLRGVMHEERNVEKLSKQILEAIRKQNKLS